MSLDLKSYYINGTCILLYFNRGSDRICADPFQEAEGEQVRRSEPICRIAQSGRGRPEGGPTTAAAPARAATKLSTGRTIFFCFRLFGMTSDKSSLMVIYFISL